MVVCPAHRLRGGLGEGTGRGIAGRSVAIVTPKARLRLMDGQLGQEQKIAVGFALRAQLLRRVDL
jgi:hypothetical protein